MAKTTVSAAIPKSRASIGRDEDTIAVSRVTAASPVIRVAMAWRL
ncbi:hypothetical protein [Agaricicola taiwanensis]|nr:hypothetical protein [Agaricicola taiwanensis]